MKRTHLLNRDLSALVAELGHLDEIVVADAGLPAPCGVPVIDLAVRPGLPTLFQVMDALKSEMVVQAAHRAEECAADLAARMAETLEAWETAQDKQVNFGTLAHADFKTRCQTVKAIIRTGDFTPYSNLILVSGVPF
ncbi:D-ribose pyranase [uncultured Roseobacter sp.]|uniref:D-ribose pyranase n=1 Tax=uncultured Roseobacter sp. TaxID=114847 RepID=UPI00262353B1|nr:D-ribose pyranase [uncultured Roseobacter sp.]